MGVLERALKKKFNGDVRAMMRCLGLDMSFLREEREEVMRKLGLDAALARDGEQVVWEDDRPVLFDPVATVARSTAAPARCLIS